MMILEVLKNQEWVKVEPENIMKDDVFKYVGQNFIYKAGEDAYVNRMGTVNFGFTVISEEELKNV